MKGMRGRVELEEYSARLRTLLYEDIATTDFPGTYT